MKLPPAPKWNIKTDDIDSADLHRRAEECERAMLPHDERAPQRNHDQNAQQPAEDAPKPATSKLLAGAKPLVVLR